MSDATVVSATKARVGLGELLRRVAEEHAVYVVQRGGRPSAVILPVEEYDRLRAAAVQDAGRAAVERALRVGRAIAEERAGAPLTDADEIIAETRRDRDADVPGLR